MGLIILISILSFAFLLAFTMLYLSKSLEKKPALMMQVVDKITAHIDQVALWGVICGAVGALLTLLVSYSGGEMLIRLASNVMVVLMALPYSFDRIAAKFQGKINPAIEQEGKNFIGWITKQEKYIGYAGVACSLLLFAMIIR